MKQQAIVKSIKDGSATIMVMREDMCGHCAQKTFCLGCAKNVTAPAANDVGAHPGDTVTVEASSKNMLISSVLVFVLPVIAGIVTYSVMNTSFPQVTVVFASVGAFLAVFAVAAVISKLIMGASLELHIVQIDKMGPYEADGSLSGSAVRRI